MNRKLVGKVNITEKMEVMRLNERVLGLIELLPAVQKASSLHDENDFLYNRIISDLGTTKRLLQKWWDKHAALYNWKRTAHGKWTIDFLTGDIYLVS